MKDTVYLTFDRKGVRSLTKRLPALSSGEFAVMIKVEVDDRFFDQITPVASIKIDEKFLIKPEVVVEPVNAPPKPPAKAK